MKKSTMCYIGFMFFVAGFLASVKWFENEGAGFFLIVALGCIVGAIIYDKLKQ